MKKLIVFFVLLIASPAWSATYYIDYAGGNDSNPGTKAEPWKLAPGMQGCLVTDTNNNNCRARTHSTTAGDTLVFKGGVTWPASVFSWDWYFGNTLTATVDATWYTGEAWSRPIFDMEAGKPTASPEGTAHMVRLYGNGHVVDNIEFKRLSLLDDGPYPGGYSMLFVGTGSGSVSGGEVKNCYFHGFYYGGTATADNMFLLQTGAVSATFDTGTSVHDNVFDGSDDWVKGQMATAYRGSAEHVYNNYFAFLANGVCCYPVGYLWGNTFNTVGDPEPWSVGNHMQNYEGEAGISGNMYIYNNYSVNPKGGGTYLFYPKSDADVYFFNNVVVNDYNQTIQFGPNYLSVGNNTIQYIWNNTLQGPTAETYARVTAGTGTAWEETSIKNNHLIGYQADLIIWGSASTQTESANIECTNATAAADCTAGSDCYISTGTYPYFPKVGGGTIGTGDDLSAFCATLTNSGPSNPGEACLKDTTLGVDYNATTHTVTYPKRTAVTRSAWDIGAYEYDLDETVPTASAYAINAAGSSFTVTFSEAVTHGAGGTTGWVLTSDGGAVTATYSSGEGSTALVYQLSRTVYSTETVTGTYTQPGNGIEDTAGNDFATVTDVAITNNSEATAGAPTYPKMTLSTGSNVTLSPSGTGSFTLAP